MQRLDAVKSIKRRLGFWSAHDDEIVLELRDGQKRLEQGILLPRGGIFLPWFLVTEITTRLMVAGEERVPLPTGADEFLGELEEGALWIYDQNAEAESQWQPLSKDDIDFLKNDQPGTGTPRAYSQSGVYFRLKPTPDSDAEANKVLKLLYKKRDATLDNDDTENNWLKYAHELMIGEAGLIVAQALRDVEAEKIFTAVRAEERQRLYLTTEARLHDNRRYVIGGRD